MALSFVIFSEHARCFGVKADKPALCQRRTLLPQAKPVLRSMAA
jgi:hypothetical protein